MSNTRTLRFTIKKSERLKSKKVIDTLFSQGSQIKNFPVLLTYAETELPVATPFQIGVTVSKRKFSNATDRNRIKRLMREVIRLKKHELMPEAGMNGRQFALMFLYAGNRMPNYKELDGKITEVISRLKQQF